MSRVERRGARRWAEPLERHGADTERLVDGVLARTTLDVDDGVELAEAYDGGAEAVAAAAGRGRRVARAAALCRALAECRDEFAPAPEEIGALTAALARAHAQAEGALAQVLGKHVALRRRVAGGVGSIATG